MCPPHASGEIYERVGRRMRFLAASVTVVMTLVLALGTNQAQEKPKFTIKEVMKEAHKEGLYKKVAGGKASDDEKKHLVELYKALAQNTPPKGDADDWKTKTSTMVAAATKAAKGDEDAAKSLLKIVNCGACHKAHK
jgi:hypothetical protein